MERGDGIDHTSLRNARMADTDERAFQETGGRILGAV